MSGIFLGVNTKKETDKCNQISFYKSLKQKTEHDKPQRLEQKSQENSNHVDTFDLFPI